MYSSRVAAPFEGEVVADDGMELDESLSVGAGVSAGELWDMHRPLEGNCVVRQHFSFMISFAVSFFLATFGWLCWCVRKRVCLCSPCGP